MAELDLVRPYAPISRLADRYLLTRVRARVYFRVGSLVIRVDSHRALVFLRLSLCCCVGDTFSSRKHDHLVQPTVGSPYIGPRVIQRFVLRVYLFPPWSVRFEFDLPDSNCPLDS